jgi:O-antigen/teichoic acid export membrane protein
MNACVLSGAIIHLFFCSRIISYSINIFSKEIWKRGLPLLKFGIPYFATAFFGAITTTIVYKIISSTEDIGFYRNGYDLILYYVGIVFSSNAIDYFPRLTSVCHDEVKKNDTVNKQINVSFTLTTPLVMTFLLAMPLIVLALYTNEFLPIVGMCVMAGLFQLHRSVSLPLEYVSLAHGHSWMFMILESIYNILIIASTYVLYPIFGLVGLGISLSFVGLTNTIILSIINLVFYKVSITRNNWMLIVAGTLLVAIVMMLCQNDNLAIRLGVGIPLTLITAIYSYITLKRGISNEQ